MTLHQPIALHFLQQSYSLFQKLFVFTEDPEERNNLADADPDRVAELIAKLDAAKATERIPDLKAQIPVQAGEASNFGGIWTPGWC